MGSILSLLMVLGLIQAGPQADHLSTAEVQAATRLKSNAGFTDIEDKGIVAASACAAQLPTLDIWTPEGYIRTLSFEAQQERVPLKLEDSDTLRALTILAVGCANGTAAGPACDSITRIILLSDLGLFVVESVSAEPIAVEWANRVGGKAQCFNLRAKFLMSDIKKVQDSDGEFRVETFSGKTPLKTYTVKVKHLKKLGLK